MDQSGDPMCPRGPVATDGHRNNEYPVLRRVFDPVYPRERRPCGLDVDEQVLGTHYRLHRLKRSDSGTAVATVCVDWQPLLGLLTALLEFACDRQ